RHGHPRRRANHNWLRCWPDVEARNKSGHDERKLTMKLVLLDRDGVLNDETGGYIKSPADVRMIPGSARALARLNRAGYKVAICTNQSVVGRGMIGNDMLMRI